MSFRTRNLIAWGLVLIASACWFFGQRMLHTESQEATTESTVVSAETATEPAEENTIATVTTYIDPYAPSVPVAEDGVYQQTDASSESEKEEKIIGYVLCIFSVGISAAAIFILRQKMPIFGPDGAFLAFAMVETVNRLLQSVPVSEIMTAFVIVVGIRELYGWARARFPLSWCLVQKIADRSKKPQMLLLTYVLWSIFLTAVFFCLYDHGSVASLFYGYPMAAIFGLLCLWKYGADLSHFQKQLGNYQHGEPIAVGNGAFSQTEVQLLDMQAQHEEAVRAAVTSERFKVELISNVSHDLRTPLTSILGYSELLQNEILSPEGKNQLQRLQQKAGYMSELVEALFELTKVSSGVVESKKEEIDLVCLLEQTIGLFDDQLARAGVNVRRSYGAQSILLITDGARMHQVFANLLGNAMKYALAGTRIYLEIKELANDYRIRMTNTASYEMDFAPEEIMQRFARGDKARSTKGSGLGLAIAQTYTESVGGSFRIAVDGDQFSAIVELPKIDRNL